MEDLAHLEHVGTRMVTGPLWRQACLNLPPMGIQLGIRFSNWILRWPECDGVTSAPREGDATG